MTGKRVRVAVNGYGVIGKRVADAVVFQMTETRQINHVRSRPLVKHSFSMGNNGRKLHYVP